jgi:hypothetical protein
LTRNQVGKVSCRAMRKLKKAVGAQEGHYLGYISYIVCLRPVRVENPRISDLSWVVENRTTT